MSIEAPDAPLPIPTSNTAVVVLPPRVFLRMHLGLGDHIICNALARRLAQQGELVLPVRQCNAPSVVFMLRDTNARIVPVADDEEAEAYIAAAHGEEDTVVDIHFWQHPQHRQLFSAEHHFDEHFYALAQLDPAIRYAEFQVKRAPAREAALAAQYPEFAAGTPYIFVHEDPVRGFRLDHARISGDLPIVTPRAGLTDNIFDYCLLIDRAAAAHCFDSSFAILMEYMGLACGRRFMHEYVRTYPKVKNGHLLNPRLRADGWTYLR